MKIGYGLRAYFDAILDAPLPERHQELLRKLDAKQVKA
jgi:hypothetical protein